jgi:hypothetical protein
VVAVAVVAVAVVAVAVVAVAVVAIFSKTDLYSQEDESLTTCNCHTG